MIKPKLISACAAFAFNLNLFFIYFIRNSCHVLGALTDCSHFHKPQIMRRNAAAVSCRQNACMLGFTSAISDFSKLETPL